MPFVPCTNVMQITMVYGYGEDQSENVFHALKGSAISLADHATIASVFGSWESTTGGLHRSSDAQLETVITTDLTTQSSTSIQHPVAPPIVGSDGDGVDASGTTWCFKWLTASRGRSFRGRTYYVAVPKASLVDNVINSTWAAAVISDYTTLLTNLNAVTGWSMVVLSRFHGVDSSGRPIPRGAGVTTPITQVAFTDLNVDYQRRRSPGHSRHH